MNRITLPGLLYYLVLPIALSLALGLLVAYDDRVAPYHPLWQFALDYEILQHYLWTTTALILILLISVGLNYRDQAFSHRYRIAVILLIAAPALGGLNLIRLDPPDVAVVLATLLWLSSVLVEDRPLRAPRVVIALLLGLAFFAVGSIMTGGLYIVLSLPSIFTKLIIVFLLANLIVSPRDHDIALKALITVARDVPAMETALARALA